MKKKHLLVLLSLAASINNSSSQNISFTSDVETGCAPLTVHFTNTSTAGTTFKWIIDSGPSHIPYTEYATDLTYIFTYPAYFHIYLWAYDGSSNLLGAYSRNVYVPGYYQVYAYSDTVCPDDIISFSCQGDADAVLWQFGDGNSAEQVAHSSSPVTHSYSAAGEYHPRVIAVNMCGRDTLTFPNPIIVTNSIPAFIPTLNVSSTTVCPDAIVYFSTYPVTYFTSLCEWDFGDGNTLMSQDLSAEHRYLSAGSYTATLTRRNNCGNQNSYSRNILVSDTQQPAAPVIYTNNINPCNGSEIQFGTDFYSNYYIQSYHWDFGDGATDTNAAPVHIYANTGTYNITFTFTDFCGHSGSVTDIITTANIVQGAVGPPVRIFPHAACPGDTIYIGNNPYSFITGSGLSYYWNFGDGNSDTSRNTSHIYANPGIYLVTRTITNVCGNSASVTDTVVINNSVIPPVNSFSILPGEACPGDVVCLGDLHPMFNTLSYKNDFYVWNYDDGFVDTTHTLFTRHSFTGTGNYFVTLTTVNRCGNQSSFTDTVMISGNVQVSTFSWYSWEEPLDGNHQACETIFFTARSNEGYNYDWNWGDGNTLTTNTNTASHVFTQEDIYAVDVTAANGCGNSKTSSKYIVVTGFCLSVDEIFSAPDGALLFPNPAASELNIQINSTQEFQFALYNSLGEKIIDKSLNNKTSSINLSAYSNGIYFYKIISEKNIIKTGKVIKQ